MGAPHRAKLQQLAALFRCESDGPGAVGHEYRCAKREEDTYDHETWLAMTVGGTLPGSCAVRDVCCECCVLLLT
jgi:hypothetical protein